MGVPALRAKKAIPRAGSNSNLDISLTSGWDVAFGDGSATYTPAVGDFVLVTYGVGAAGNPAIGVNTAGYAEIAELYRDENSSDASLSVSWKVMGATPDTEVQVSGTGSNNNAGVIIIEVWSGVDPTTPLDVTPTTATGQDGGQPNPPAITPVTAGATVIVCCSAAAPTAAVFTQAGSELAAFLSAAQADTTDAVAGTGYFNWTSGTYDPVAWTGSTLGVGDSWCAITLAVRPSPPPTATQRAFRFYEDGTESGSVAIDAENTDISRDPSVASNLLLRLGIQVGSETISARVIRFQYSKNGGTWTNLATSGSNVRVFDSANFSDGVGTTQRLSSGTGSFFSGHTDETGSHLDTLSANNFTEYLIALQLQAADLADGDTLDFRAIDSASTDTTVFTYNEVPRITVDAGSTPITAQDSTNAHSSDQATITTNNAITAQESTHSHSSDQATVSLTPVTIASNEATHAHSSDQASLAQKSTVTAQDALHSHLSDQATIATQNVVVPQESTHLLSSDEATITFAAQIVAQDANHAHSSDEGTITTQNVLIPDDSTHILGSDEAQIQAKFAIIAQDSTHNHASDEAVLTVSGVISAQDSSHDHLADQANLTFIPLILANDSAHSVTSDEAIVAAISAVLADDSLHETTSDQATIGQKSVVAAEDSLHSVDSDQTTISTLDQIGVDDASHALLSDQAAITAFFAVAPDNAIHVHLSDQVLVTVSDVIAGDDAVHTVSSDASTIAVSFGITPLDAIHGHNADQVLIVFKAPVEPGDSFHTVTSEEAAIVFGVVLQPDEALHNHQSDQALVTSLVTVVAHDSLHLHTADTGVMFIVEGVGANVLTVPLPGILFAGANNALAAPGITTLVVPKREILQ